MKTKMLFILLVMLSFSIKAQDQEVRLFIADFAGDEKINDGDSIILYLEGIHNTIIKEEWELRGIDISINDISLAEITPARISKEIKLKDEIYDKDLLLYKIKKSELAPEKLDAIRNLQDLSKVYLTIQLPDDAVISETVSLTPLDNNAKWRFWVSFIAPALIIIFMLFLLRYGILKDESSTKSPDSDNPPGEVPYSFSRSQLYWWTIIISCSIAFIWVMTGDFGINETAWILLGITGATTGVSVAIDKSDISSDKIKVRIQDDGSEGWFKDILTDGTGNISIHRTQAFLFNVGFGVFYLLDVLIGLELPLFDSNIYVLLGISNGAYAFVKQNENKGK